jgi:hypothetical protein
METAAVPGRESPQEGFPARVRKVLARTRYKTPYGFTKGKKKSGFSNATLMGWFRKRGSRFPVSKSLLEFVRLTGASLDYVVMGEGPEFRGQDVPTGELAEMLRKEVVRRFTHEFSELGPSFAKWLPDPETILRDTTKQQLLRFRDAWIRRVTVEQRPAAPAKAQRRGGNKTP